MKRKLSITLTLMLTFLFTLSASAFARELGKNVDVTLPDFKVTINGVAVENTQRRYPLFLYQGVTYFPMTYYDARFLGLETKGDISGDPWIEQTGISAGYRDYVTGSPNKTHFQATVANFNTIRVNDRMIDNNLEPYPLLYYNNVIYFPLTWAFATQAFGWDLQFTPKNGLVIHSAGTHAIPIKITDQRNDSSYAFHLIGDQLVYEGQEGKIYRTTLTDPGKKTAIAQLPGDNNNRWPNTGFYTDNGQHYLRYHLGGGFMGSDHVYQILVNGTIAKEPLQRSYGVVKQFPGLIVQASLLGNDFSVIENGVTRGIGEPGYMYTCQTDKNGHTSSCDDIYLVGRDLYLVAAKKDAKNSICKVNIDTNITKEVAPLSSGGFKMVGQSIYHNMNNTLYEIHIKTGASKPLVSLPQLSTLEGYQGTDLFAPLHEQLYYLGKDQALYRLGQEAPLNEGAKVTMLHSFTDYLAVTFEEKPEVANRLLVFDQKGDCVFKSADVTNQITIDGQKMVYKADDMLYLVNLK